MGWGNIGMSWTRYAKGTPIRHCERCHLDYVATTDTCPNCSHLNDAGLRQFLAELDAKKNRSNKLFIAFIMALVLYAVVILFVLPA